MEKPSIELTHNPDEENPSLEIEAEELIRIVTEFRDAPSDDGLINPSTWTLSESVDRVVAICEKVTVETAAQLYHLFQRISEEIDCHFKNDENARKIHRISHLFTNMEGLTSEEKTYIYDYIRRYQEEELDDEDPDDPADWWKRGKK
jgi:hypothetical protein